MRTTYVDVAERDQWNAFVAEAPHGHVLQSWEWGEIKARTGWRAVRLSVEESGSRRAAAQVLIRTLPYGAGKLAYVPKGPVLDYTNQALVSEMLQALLALAKEEKVISLKIEPELLESPTVRQQLEDHGLRPAQPVQMRSTIWVDLSAGEEELLARQKQKTRYNIRLAERKGVTVRAGSPDEIRDWYRMYVATSSRDTFTIRDEAYYRLVMDVMEPRGMAKLLLAHHEGELLAGVIVFCFGQVAQYMYGASSNSKRNLMAPYLAQWEGMRWAKSRGVSTYDLWGIPDHLEENEELWGVYRHKRGYGGEMVRYVGAFDMVRSPLQHLALERVARPLFRRMGRLGVGVGE